MPGTPTESYIGAESLKNFLKELRNSAPPPFSSLLCFPLLFCSCHLSSTFKLYLSIVPSIIIALSSLLTNLLNLCQICSLLSSLPESVLVAPSSQISLIAVCVSLLTLQV